MTDKTGTVSLEEIDLSSHDAFVERVPHEWFRTLRREAPVRFNPEPDGPGFWAVTRYWDIREVHRNFAVYSSEVGGTSLEDLDQDQIEARKSMIDTDPPRHTELRRLIARRFTSRAVKVWEEAVRTVCDRVLNEALPKGEFDFVEEISSEIPMQVFAEILGVPQEDRRYIVEMGDRILGNQDPEYAQPPEDAHRTLPFSSPVALEMFEFGRKLAAAAAREPIRRHRLAARRLGPHPARVRRLLRAAGHRRQRDDAAHHHPRPARPPGVPGPAGASAPRPLAVRAGGRRDAPLGDGRPLLPSHHDPGHRAGRHTDTGRRQGHDLANLRQPRRRVLRGPRHLRRRPLPEQAHGVRAWRHPPLPRRAPGAPGGPHRLRGVAQARRRVRDHGSARAPAVELLQRHQALPVRVTA